MSSRTSGIRGLVRMLGSANAALASSGSAASNSPRGPRRSPPASAASPTSVEQLVDAREQPLAPVVLGLAAEPEDPRDLRVLLRRDVGRVARRRHELARQRRRCSAARAAGRSPFARPCAIAEARADRVRERVVDADERVREREPGDASRRWPCRCAPRGREPSAIGARQRVEDQVDGLHAERVGVRRGEDRDRRLERVGERVDAGVGGHRRRHASGSASGRRSPCRARASSRPASPCARPTREHRGRRDLRAGAGGRRDRDQPHACARSAGSAATRLRASRNGSVSSRSVSSGLLVEQPHRLGGVDHRAAADGDDRRRRRSRSSMLHAGADLRLGRLRLDVGEHVHAPAVEVAAHLVDDAAGLASAVGDDHAPCARRASRRFSSAPALKYVSDGHPEPLRRRLAARDGLDVEQVAVVDVVGRGRAAPGAAAERERRRHRVVDAAQRADRGRRVDEDPPGADRQREARRSTSSSVA